MFLQLNHRLFDIYKAIRAFVKECCLATKDFPQEKRFALVLQIRKVAFSVPLDFSEGFSRKSEARSKRFFKISRGSIVEIVGALERAEDLAYSKKEN